MSFWQAAWCEPFAPEIAELALAGLAVDSDPPPIAKVNQLARARALQAGNGQSLRFTLADEGVNSQSFAYETMVYGTGMVPTRDSGEDGWHDYFNALIWLAFPRAKSALNAMQAAQIQRNGVQTSRGPVRDFITLFDESAVVLAYSDPEMLQALKDKNWQQALVDQRDYWQISITPFTFGHALLQKLRKPYKAICAQAFAIEVSESFATLAPEAQRAVIDRKLAAALEEECARLENHVAAQPEEKPAKPLFPLPVLGIPGWWADNQAASFYDDASVFR